MGNTGPQVSYQPEGHGGLDYTLKHNVRVGDRCGPQETLGSDTVPSLKGHSLANSSRRSKIGTIGPNCEASV